jgi:hypothetical protein
MRHCRSRPARAALEARYGVQMTTGRMEAFSDGVIAILITVMVLELPKPSGGTWAALGPVAPVLLSYLMSFVYLGIYWNNHHHMLQATTKVSGLILWANLHLLFWLSLIPFTTAWLGEHGFAAVPAAGYGIVLLAAAVHGGHRAVLRQPLARCCHLRRRGLDVADPRPALRAHYHRQRPASARTRIGFMTVTGQMTASNSARHSRRGMPGALMLSGL